MHSPDLRSVRAILIDDDYWVAVEELKVPENFFETIG
jgi:hypothetical protein